MRFFATADFEAWLGAHPTRLIWRTIFPRLLSRYRPGLRALVIFGGLAHLPRVPDPSSDLDLFLLFAAEEPEPDNRIIRGEIYSWLPDSRDRELLDVFAWNEPQLERLYFWENSIAHGVARGLLVWPEPPAAETLLRRVHQWSERLPPREGRHE